MIPRIGALRLPPRAAILFLIAIVLPCTVLAVLTVRLMTLQRELAGKRRVEARSALIDTLRSEIWAQMERLKLHAVMQGGTRAAGATASNIDGVALVAAVESGRMRLPWEPDPVSAGAAAFDGPGSYADAIRAAEYAERGPGGAGETLAAYKRAIATAASPAQAAFARLGLSRTLETVGRVGDGAIEDRQLLRIPLAVRDDVGTPFALYATRRLLTRPPDRDVDYRAMVEVLDGCLIAAPPLPPHALYMVRDLGRMVAAQAPEDGLRASGNRVVEQATEMSREREQAVMLQQSLVAVLPAATSPIVAEVPWVLFGPKDTQWLVSASVSGQESVVVAVRLATFTQNMERSPLLRGNGIRLVATGTAPGEPLGGMLAALSVVLGPSEPDSLAREETLQRRFYIAALLLVVGIAWSGGYFFWQHVRRDLRVADMRSQFVSSVSHELKTPVTAIRMFAETLLLGRTSRPEARHEYLETIVNESERLTRLINNVLDFSKIEQGTKAYCMAPQSLNAIVEAAAKVMEYPLLREGFELRRTLDPAVPTVSVDRDAIQQAILNLLSNAMKYSGTSRTIDLALSTMGREVHISVTDGGYGIADNEQSRVFQKFYRSAAPEHQRVPGTGLGLTIVEHVAAAHGGRVAVRSAVGQGSTFSIVLPLPVTNDIEQIHDRMLDSAHASHSGD